MFRALLCQKECWLKGEKVNVCVTAEVHSSADAPENKLQSDMGPGFPPLAFLSASTNQTTASKLKHQTEIADVEPERKRISLLLLTS